MSDKPDYQKAQEIIRDALIRSVNECAMAKHPVEWSIMVMASVSAVMAETASWSPLLQTPEGRLRLVETMLEPLRAYMLADLAGRANHEIETARKAIKQ